MAGERYWSLCLASLILMRDIVDFMRCFQQAHTQTYNRYIYIYMYMIKSLSVYIYIYIQEKQENKMDG